MTSTPAVPPPAPASSFQLEAAHESFRAEVRAFAESRFAAKAAYWDEHEEFPVAGQQIPFRDVQDRMLFVEALETATCFEEGVITSAAAANIGSIMGIGFPANTGGAAQFMTGWQRQDEHGKPVGEIGLAAFVARADELAAAYGDRFRPGAYLRGLAERGESFPA